mgnify:CR=1 FL=1
MRTIKFPKMFNSNSTNVWEANEYLESTKQSLKLLLQTERGELFGDPYFGLMLKHYLFNQNNYILKDVIIDIIYTQIAIFIPQLHIKREDIQIIQNKEKGRLYCRFKAVNQIDYQVNTFNIVLFQQTDSMQ